MDVSVIIVNYNVEHFLSQCLLSVRAGVAVLEQAGYAVEALQIPGDPERVIAETVQTREADLLIMGAYGHSPLRSLIFGSKTSDLLRSATLPTLLLR